MIVRPGQPSTVDVVGGKGFSLMQLHARGLPVPAFFVITTECHQRSTGGAVGDDDRTAIVDAWRSLGGEHHPVAVRSSGIDEDSDSDSYAGVFDTVLGVDSEQQLVAAIEQCWSSATSAEATAYRVARGIDGTERPQGMAVVVQRMVRAEWSGVLFTADPVRGALSVSRINAVPGLGEALVSGLADPEEIAVETSTGRVLERRRPPDTPALPDSILKAVVALGRAATVGEHLPQDLEWAASEHGVELLQSRPITTIADTVHARPLEPWVSDPLAAPDDEHRRWTRAYADEMWTPPVSPLFYDVQNLTPMVTTYLERHGVTTHRPDVFKYHRAAAYLDVELLERMLHLVPRSMRHDGAINQLPVDRRQPARDAPWNWRGTARRLILFEVRRRRRWSVFETWRLLDRAWPTFLAEATQWARTDLTSLADDELDDFRERVRATAATIGPECSISVTYHAADLRLIVTDMLRRWTTAPASESYASVSSGLDDSITVDESTALWTIATMVREATTDASLDELTLDAARRNATSWRLAPAIERFDGFIEQHGHRGANYKDLAHPRWGDRPDLAWALVVSIARNPGESPAVRHARTAAERRRTQAALIATVSGPTAPLERGLLRRAFRLNERYASLRDNHRYYYDHVWWAYRRYFLERGRRLAERGLLEGAEDIMFLCRAEIEALGGGTADTALIDERVRSRRRAWETSRIETPAKYLVRGYLPVEDAPIGAPTSADLTGLPTSPGTVVGKVRVATDASELTAIDVGEILVARQTDPGWTPVFSRLAGLVLETGGVLAHGASLCREYGLPCVTVVDRATSRLHTGDEIELCGSTGNIKVLARAGAEERR